MDRKLLKTAVVVGVSLILYFTSPSGMPEPARRMLCIFAFAALFWAWNIISLFSTSVLVVLLEVFLLCRPSGFLSLPHSIDYQLFLVPFGSPVIILFFGGFVLASAIHKYKIDEFCSIRLLKICGLHPLSIMFGFAGITGVLSMWMSNTATTAMMIAMFMPFLKQMKSNDVYRTGLILSIPFAANIGGIATPIGTPPNAIAMGLLSDYGFKINFLQWTVIGVPIALALMGIMVLILYGLYPSNSKKLAIYFEQSSELTREGKIVIAVTVFTIVLWLTSGWHMVPSSVIALLAASFFLSTDILNKNDLKNIDWDILILMWGGLALGKGMELSGLTQWIVGGGLFQQTGFVLLVVFMIFAVLLATFMSNTATANLLIPIALAVPGESKLILAVAVAVACSLGMALPVSTPPNAMAFGTGMISTKSMLIAGLLVSLVGLVCVLLIIKIVVQ